MSVKLAEFRERVGRSMGSVLLEREMLKALEDAELREERAGDLLKQRTAEARGLERRVHELLRENEAWQTRFATANGYGSDAGAPPWMKP